MLIKTASLTPLILSIVRDKGTDIPHTGQFETLDEPGTYLCRQCGLALFRSRAKFNAHCGWPSFDKEEPNTVQKLPDSDGRRTEIVCQRCLAHLGHIFYGEGFTAENARYCVNSTSLDFTLDTEVSDTEEAVFAGGCFWGVEHLLQKLPGVVLTEVGYTAGYKPHPTYDSVCAGQTGHVEAARVVYDVNRLSFKDVAQYFFEIHDPTQQDGQGPDRGEQYVSVAFYYNQQQKNCLIELINQLTQQGLDIATMLEPVGVFWPAEEYHQRYYEKTKKSPYCHAYTKRF